MQRSVEVGGQDFYLDLLFYHLRLRAFVVIELKVTEFKPEYAGKMNFYLSAVDDLLRHEQDQPSIGIILCKTKNKVVGGVRAPRHAETYRRFVVRAYRVAPRKTARQPSDNRRTRSGIENAINTNVKELRG